MAILTREQILQAQDLRTEEVPVPEWGGSVLVRGMTGAERDAFEASIVEMHGKNSQVNMANVRAKLAARTIVDEAGERLFTEKDIEALGKKNATALQRIFEVAQRLSGIGQSDIEELVKNSAGGPNGSSTSG